jgi:4-hydroxy-tetrahydrodipicolinate reductase
VKLLAAKDWAEVVGGVDIDPAKIGRGVGEVCGIPLAGEARVYGSFKAMLEEARPDVVIHTAGSRILPTLM